MFYNVIDTWNYGTSHDDGVILSNKLQRLKNLVSKNSFKNIDTIALSPSTFNEVFVETSSSVNRFLEINQQIRLDIREDNPYGLLTLECREALISPLIALPTIIKSGLPDGIPMMEFTLKRNNDEDESVVEYKKDLGAYLRVTGLLLPKFKFLR